MNEIATIDEVIARLDAIIHEAYQNHSRLGYFPALYRRVTIAVKEGIEAGKFDDGPRMERLDVLFASRYFDAFDAFKQGNSLNVSWLAAFEAAGRWSPTVVQHLIYGINAHIHLDLGIAAAETVWPGPIGPLESDFNRINLLLASLIESVEDELGEISPPFEWVDLAAGKIDEYLALFGIRAARDFAWDVAQRFSVLERGEWPAEEKVLDEQVSSFADRIRNPRWSFRLLLLLIRLGEEKSVRSVIEILTSEQ